MLTIQFGQCGNQLGHSLFEQISTDLDAKETGVTKEINSSYVERSFEKWFTGISKDGRRLARSVLIDTEHKVIRKICDDSLSSGKWTYRPSNCICEAGGGSANNWAYGNLVKGPQLKDKILNLTRKEIEKMDNFEGMLLLLSSAGGTGSGVGSFSVNLLREEYPNKTIIGSVVLPFTSGEVGVQNYNTMLTLATLSEGTDLNFVFQNEELQSMCSKVLKNFEAKFIDINDFISKKLCAIFQPIDETNIWYNANQLASFLASHPNYKFATIKSTPHMSTVVSQYESFSNWKLYIQQLKQNLKVAGSNRYYKSVSNILVTRGKISENDPIVCDELSSKDLFVDWLHPKDSFNAVNCRRRLLGQEKFLSLVTNNAQIYEVLDNIVDKAWDTYTNAAFLHHYKKFGLEENDFLKAFAKCENVISNYKNL